MKRRVVSLWLPRLPIERLRRRLPAGETLPSPFALSEAGPHGLEVAALDEAAAALRVRPGQALADARAMLPRLAVRPIDRAADAALLARLARWCLRFTPVVAVDGADGLFLDVAGAAHLHGGERALLNELVARLRAAGFDARAAVAPTAGAAWALARFAPGRAAPADEARLREALAPLPAAGLRLDPATVDTLARFGLRRIGDLYPLPRAALVARFRDEAVALRLDQALGRAAEALDPIEEPPRYRAVARLPAPILEAAQIRHWLERLAARLAARLRAGGVGARHLRLAATRLDGDTAGFELRFAGPTRSVEHMLRLARDRVEEIDPGFGIDALRLEALLVDDLPPDQESFVRAPRDARDRLAFADLVANRLGRGSVYALRPVASHIPERAERRAAPGEADAAATAVVGAWRPPLLLDPPEPVESAVAEVPDGPPISFVWRRARHRVVRAAGPERIAPEWWRLRPRERTRDYYLVECEGGRRFWLFRHGLFDEPEPPTWHMHGLMP